MALSRLELISAHGDQTLPRLRFVLHGLSAVENQKMLKDGLTFIEGKAVVSTNLMQAYEAASDSGVITAIAIPPAFHLGYATFTTAYIDRSLKMVLGAPLRYASARKQLALYMDEDTEAARTRIEREAMAGFSVSSHPSIKIDPRYAIGGFDASVSLKNVVTQLEVSARALEPIDFDVFESSFSGLFVVRQAAEAVLVPTMIRDLVTATVESVVLSRVRIMRWQGLALLGYRFREGREDVVVAKPADVNAHRRDMDEYGRLIASSHMFDGELAWLKTYVAHELDLMRVELDGAELEAA